LVNRPSGHRACNGLPQNASSDAHNEQRRAPQVVVNKSLLDKSLLPLLTDEPTMLPAWDPMGSLAAVGRQQQQQHQQEHPGGSEATDPRCRI